MKQAVQPSNGWEAFLPDENTAYSHLPDPVYRAADGMSKSSLDLMTKRSWGRGGSPMHMRYEWDNPTAPTEPMILGSALDCLLLEPEEFNDRFVVDNTGWRRNTLAWKAWAEGQKGKSILRREQWENLEGAHEALVTHPRVKRLLKGNVPQVSCFWEHDIGEGRKVACKGRLDGYDPISGIAWDLKTVGDADMQSFRRAVVNRHYHVQAYAYSEGLRACGELYRQFLFVAVEPSPPYGIAIYEPSLALHMAAKGLWANGLRQYARCLHNDDWPGYTLDIQKLEPFS